MGNNINLHDYGLGDLARYNFEENDKNLTKGYNIDKNKELLAVRSIFDKESKQFIQAEITVIDKKIITSWNKFKSFFGKGPLANINYDFFTVGKFVEGKVRGIKADATEQMRKSSVELIKDFKLLPFQHDQQQIVNNIYAIANRMKFVHPHRDDKLFDLVSGDIDSKPRVLVGAIRPPMKNIKIKHNPGINARFLSIYVQSQLAAEQPISPRFQATIKMSDEVRGHKAIPLSLTDSSQTTMDFLKAREIRLTDKIAQENIHQVIVGFN